MWHAAKPEARDVLAGLVEEHRALDVVDLAEVESLAPRIDVLPHVHHDDLEPELRRALAHFLEKRSLRLARSSPAGEEVQDVLLAPVLLGRPRAAVDHVGQAERRERLSDERMAPLLRELGGLALQPVPEHADRAGAGIRDVHGAGLLVDGEVPGRGADRYPRPFPA